MTKHVIGLVCYAVFVGVLSASAICLATSRKPSADTNRLLALASQKFSDLTRAETVLLEFADLANLNRGEWAAVGPSSDPNDPSNDPKDAANWGKDRQVRATLIEWLAIDRAALPLIHPGGIHLLGARVAGPIDLSFVRVPFGIAMIRCSIPELMRLEATEIPRLDLSGSYTNAIFAPDMHVAGSLYLGWDNHDYGRFHASDEVYLAGSKVEGELNFSDGSFEHFRSSFNSEQKELKVALDASDVEVKRSVMLCCNFQSNGAVLLGEDSIGGDLGLAGGHFINPNNIALDLSLAHIGGSLVFAWEPFGGFESDGEVSMGGTHVGGLFLAKQAKFGGKTTERHGLFAGGLNVSGVMLWQNIDLQNGATLDLPAVSVLQLADDERSWPAPGKLNLDGMIYESFGSVKDAASRLRWLALQPEFHSQPYRQLAKVLRSNGDDAGAVSVLIAEQDARYRNSYLPRRIWAAFLKTTVGYGHRPLLAIIWMLMVVLIGWAMVSAGLRAGVMRPTWPENVPHSSQPDYEDLHPFLYSLDVFLPFVNLHQEHYWWPNSNASGAYSIMGRSISVRGSVLRYYLWLQIIAGWLLSAIFIAGVTGLIRND